MDKKYISILAVLLLFKTILFIPFVGNTFSDEKISTINNRVEQTPQEVIDNTIYDNLPIDKLIVDTNNDSKADNINWYSKGSEYYIFLPKGYDRNNLRVHFCDKENVRVSVYNTNKELLGTIKNNSITNLFTNDKVIIKTDINSKKEHTYTINIMQSDAPSMSINLENGASDFNAINNSKNHTVERSGYAVVIDSEGNQLYANIASMKGRGNRTWDKVKKPYQIKFEDKQDIFGMGSAKTYNLLANVLDGPLARNQLAFEIARELELPYAVDSTPVELYVNNNYLGSYLLTEKVQIKKNRIDVDENEFLFEIENHPSGNDYVRTSHGILITIKNPDFDELNASERAQVKRKALNYLNKIERIIYGNASDEEVQKYIDYDSFAKFYWTQELTMNYDALRGSNYFYTKDGKLYAGPIWDMDNTLNRSWIYASTSGYYVLDNASLNVRIGGNWYRGLIRRTEFSNTIDNVFYDSFNKINNLQSTLDSYLDSIKLTTKMNYTRRYFNTTITYRPAIPGNNYLNGSIDYMKKYLEQRLNFYRGQYKNILYTDLTYTYNKNGNDVESSFTNGINVIPHDINDIKIYGTDVYGNKKLVKEVTITNDEVKFTLSNNTSSSRKRTNRITYTYKFERKG